MDLVASLPVFLLSVVLISASPGPAMALIFRRAALRGVRATVPTVLGLEAGLYVWAIAAGAGLAALVAASESAYLVLRVVGAAVLVTLGARAWFAAWRDRGDGPEVVATNGRRSGWLAFGEGAVVQLANPKAAVFMFAFYPQFIPAGRDAAGHDGTARVAAGRRRGRPLRQPRGCGRPGRSLVPSPADQAPARGSQRHRADRPRRPRGCVEPLTTAPTDVQFCPIGQSSTSIRPGPRRRSPNWAIFDVDPSRRRSTP
ncbi:MAG: LysE family translocator [Nocardioidaceae bacterium]